MDREKSLAEAIYEQQQAWLVSQKRVTGGMWDVVPASVAQQQLYWQRMEQVRRLRLVHKLKFREIAEIFGVSIVRARAIFLQSDTALLGRCPVEVYFRDGSIYALYEMILFYERYEGK